MALTLLELVTRAVQQEDGAGTTDSVWCTRLEPSVSQTSDFSFNKEVQEDKDAEVQYLEDLIVREDPGGWEVSVPNAAREDELVKKLKKKLENVGTFTTEEFIAMVRPALELVSGLGSEIQNPDEKDTVDDEKNEEGESEERLFVRLLRRGGFRVGQRLLASIINCILGLQFWSALKALIRKGLVNSVSHRDLVQKLVDHRKAGLLTLTFNYVLDLSPSDLLVALKFLLDQSLVSLDEFEVERLRWRKAASAAVDAAVRRRHLFFKREKEIEEDLKNEEAERMRLAREQAELAMAEDGSINEGEPFNKNAFAPVYEMKYQSAWLPLRERERRSNETLEMTIKGSVSSALVLAMATDGFKGWETCLHTLLASGQDEAILAAIIAELDSSEAVRLLQYLRKWLDLYSNRLSRHPNPVLKNSSGHHVPSSQTVVQWVNMVLDGQYPKCVLSPEIWPELRAIQNHVKATVAISSKIAPILGTLEHLRHKRPLPPLRLDSGLRRNNTIEYLDISGYR